MSQLTAPPPSDLDDAREARAARARVYRRRRAGVFGSLALVVGLVAGGGVYAGSALGAEVPAVAAEVVDPAPVAQPAPELALPPFGSYGVGAVGFDGLLVAGGDPAPAPIASITKVVTALVVLEQHPIPAGEAGPEIRYTDADVDIYWDMVAQNGSVAPVAAGASLSLRQSLEALMLPSGNNYGTSIANWAFGSVDAYVAAAADWLARNGLTQTVIVDPHGLSLDNRSVPADLVRLGQLALADPTLAQIVASSTADIPAIGQVRNSNKLLGTLGVDGIKTGTTDTTANLLFSTDVAVGAEQITVVGVVLGGPTHRELNEVIATLLSGVMSGFREVPAIAAGTDYATFDTAWGQTARAEAAAAASVVVWGETPVDVAVAVDPVALAPAGTEVGTATVTAGSRTVSVPLVLDAPLEDPGTWWRLTNPGALDDAAASAGE